MAKSIGLVLCGVLALGLGACVHQDWRPVGGGPVMTAPSPNTTDMSTGEHGRPRHRVKGQTGPAIETGPGLGSASSTGDSVFGY